MRNTQLDYTHFFPQVLQVVPTDNFEVYAYFNDGSVHLFDAKPLIKPNTVFEQLADIKVFKEKLTVLNHTIAWDMEGNRDPCKAIDIDPFTVFETERVSCPL